MISEKDIPHIQTAIEIARSSVSEGSSPKPLVGAVVAKRERELGRAHRGELRPGDHAEYTLLERKLRDDDVTDGTLYTTLEPCTGRGPGKIPCAERIKNRRLSRVVIGILDPDQRICGRGVRELREGGIEVDLFPAEYMRQVEDQNREFIYDREQLWKKWNTISAVGLTLEKVELEPADAERVYYKFKLRLYWTNDGHALRLEKPRWLPGGIPLQGSEIGYRYQPWTGSGWGPELTEIEVQQNQKFRIYVGLDFDPKVTAMAPSLLEQGRLGTLILPVTLSNDHKLELYVRPKSIMFQSNPV